MQYRALVRIIHDHVVTLPGEILELDDETAAPLLECKAIEPGHKPFGRAIVVPGTASQ